MWNAARGSDGRPPLTYNGAADVGDKCLGTGKHARLGAKLQGDPYVGDVSRRKVEDMEEEVKKMSEEVANLKARNRGSPGQSRKRLTNGRRCSGGGKGRSSDSCSDNNLHHEACQLL